MTRRSIFRIVGIVCFCLTPTLAYAQAPNSDTTSHDPPEAIRTFYLENAHVKDVMTVVRSLLAAKNVAADEQLQAIWLRDTAETLALAERLVKTQDRPRNEVVVDVELLELNVEKLHRLAGAAGLPARLSQDELERLVEGADAKVLAHPKLSLVAGRKAELLIGERVPIPVDGEGAISYQEVGFHLVVGSRVHAGADEVTLDFELEMSDRARGEERPVFETRRIVSSVRLENGQVYFLAGLSHAASGLVAMPDAERSEVALALTPRVTRRVEVRAEPAFGVGR